MLSEIVRFEWRYHSRQVAFLAASVLFFGFGLLLSFRFGPENVAVNSPYLVMEAFGLMSLIALIAASVFAASAVLRDDEHRMSEIIYSTPVGRFRYLTGRFGGAFLATLTVAAFSGLGMFIGALMPWVEPERVAALDARPYLAAFGVITIPNVLFATALLFAVAVLTRNAIATYAASIALYVLYFVAAALTNSPLMAASRPGGSGESVIASLLDPFALTSFFEVTRYWTAAEKNLRFIPVSGALLANRVLWVAAAVGVVAVAYSRFRFSVRRDRPNRTDRTNRTYKTYKTYKSYRSYQPDQPSWTASYRSAVAIELRTLLARSTLLLLLLWVGLAVTEIYGDVLSGEYRSTSLPATSLIIAALQPPVSVIGLILIVYYSAELFWREQRFRVASIIDSTPVASSVMIASKWTALAVLLASVLGSGALAGVVLQVSKGYVNFEPGLYLSFFYFAGVPLLLYAAAALFIHALSPGKYAGMIFFIAFVIVTRRASAIGLEHDLWRFARPPDVLFTNFNGYGHTAAPFHWFTLHWSVLALLLATIAAMLWRRISAPLVERLRMLARPNRTARALIVAFLVSGLWIFYNTNVARAYVTSDAQNDWKADYEKLYKRFEPMPRPRIVSVDSNVDLYPEEQRYRIAGRYVLVNETAKPIERVYIIIRREAHVAALSLSSARLAEQDQRFGVHRFDFTPPLAPRARAELRFDVSFDARGFAGGQQDNAVVGNGSYLMSFRGYPTIGYRRSYELADPRERRKRGLSASAAAELDGDGSHGAIGASEDEWVDFSATVSTTADQIAVAPGALERSWEQNGRRYFRYRTGVPILNRFAITSARYAVAKRQHGNIAVELYYHPPHSANIEHMLDVAVTSLDVLQKSFGAYPHRTLKIVELPSYWPMAGYALPDTVYLREDRAFLTDRRDTTRPDLVGRRVAHEIAHQWFGHRVYTENVQGASVIIESLTKYSELLVMERMHGREHVRQLLEIELDRYLSGRANETLAEVPLIKTDNQSYLFYNKGAVVLFAIRDLLGAEQMDAAIRAMMRKQRPTSVDLANHLRAAGDERARPLIDEWMRDIVLYDLRVDSAEAKRRADGRYDVTLRVFAAKTRADGQGNERPLELQEPIEIAVGSDSRKHLLRSGVNDIKVTVNEQPSEITIDPWITRLDKNPQDNVKRF